MIKLLFERDGDCDCVIFCLFPMSTLCHFLTDSFYIVQTVSILSEQFLYCLDRFNTIHMVSILSRRFQYFPNSACSAGLFQYCRECFKLSQWFQTVWQLTYLGQCHLMPAWKGDKKKMIDSCGKKGDWPALNETIWQIWEEGQGRQRLKDLQLTVRSRQL